MPGPHPMDPLRLSAAARGFVISSVLRNLAAIAPDAGHARDLGSKAHDLASRSASGLLRGWEDGDDWCPTHPHWPIPHINIGDLFQPQPEPWRGASRYGPSPEPWRRMAGWVDRLPREQLGAVVDAAASSLLQRVRG